MAILVVDDEPGVRALLERMLREAGDGWDVRHAASAREALALAVEPAVECVLLDHRMPDADGLTVLREIRRTRPAAEGPASPITPKKPNPDQS